VFDVSFIELLVIGVVGLLVLGPERLPAAARTVGAFLRKARQSWNSVRGEFEREFAADEFKRSMRKTRDELSTSLNPFADEPAKAADHTAAPTPAIESTYAPPPRGPEHAPHD
jgi:sec-independent protein translocase protein TatB